MKVFDGDGFLARIDNHREDIGLEVAIRLGFIDAPEMEQPGGREARDFLSSLIAGKSVDLAVLIKMDTGKIMDRHNRVVAVPYLEIDKTERSADGGTLFRRILSQLTEPSHRNIELEMVLNGWAWLLDRYAPDACYFEALDDAQRNRRGIWARDDNLHPWEFKKRRYRALRPASKSLQQSLFSPNSGQILCPAEGCSGELVMKNGRYGNFVGCSNFPRCRHSQNLNE